MADLSTGIEYPTIELGGVTYVVKFTRGGIVYRLSKMGTNLAEMHGARKFATLIDVLFAALHDQFNGTPDELAEMVLSEQKAAAVDEVVSIALKKAFPPAQLKADGAAGDTAPVH